MAYIVIEDTFDIRGYITPTGPPPAPEATAVSPLPVADVVMSASPQAHHFAIVGDPDVVAMPQGGSQGEPQASHVGRQLDGGTDDLTGMRVRPEPRVIVPDAKLATLPGDDERVGLHARSVRRRSRHLP